LSTLEGYRPHCLRLEDWPEACRRGWEQALREPGLFDDAKPASKWRAATERKNRKGFGVYLHWLQRRGLPEANAEPSDLVTLPRVKAFWAALVEIERAPLTIYNRLGELHAAMQALGPDKDWAWLSNVVKSLRRSARPSRQKLNRLQPVDQLTGLGLDLMARAEGDACLTDHKRALMFRDGLMIALLAYRPLRLKNLAGLAIGSSLVIDSARACIAFSGDEMKGKRPLDVPFPTALRSRLQAYLNVYRPYLLTLQHVAAKAPVDALWISSEGRRMDDGSICVAIKKRTRAAFGIDLSPHLFRDCAVTTVVRDAPASARLTRDLLGHASLDVTNQHYNQALMIESSRRHSAMMERLMALHPFEGTATCAP
jgi:integrase/recombinase XerD